MKKQKRKKLKDKYDNKYYELQRKLMDEVYISIKNVKVIICKASKDSRIYKNTRSFIRRKNKKLPI